jgi:hypothetical protein
VQPVTDRVASAQEVDRSAAGRGDRRTLADPRRRASPVPSRREIEQQLTALVALEAECCAFLSLTVHTVHDAVILEVTGPPGSQPVITALFAASQT